MRINSTQLERNFIKLDLYLDNKKYETEEKGLKVKGFEH